jgi:fucose 4-O-acetylase-like acetyltransferase
MQPQVKDSALKNRKNPPQNNSPTPPQVEWVHMAKGVAILLIVNVHVLRGLVDSDRHVNLLFYNVSDYLSVWIALPLFFFLSGMFAPGSLIKYGKGLWISKFQTVMYPYFLWSWINIGLKLMMGKFVNSRVEPIQFITTVYSPYDIYYFLYVLFFCFILYQMTGRMKEGFLFGGSLVLYAIHVNFTLYPAFDLLFRYFLFFAAGICFTSQLLDGKWQNLFLTSCKGGGLLVCITVILACGSTWGMDHPHWFDHDKTYLLLINSAIGITSVIFLCRVMEKYQFKAVLYRIGQFSLGIYLSHTLFTAGSRIILGRLSPDMNTFIVYMTAILSGVFIPLLLFYFAKRHNLYLFYRL